MIDVNRFDKRALDALVRLKEPHMKWFLDLVDSELEDAKRKLVYTGETDALRRLQGRAEALEDVLRAVEDASKVRNGAPAPKTGSTP